MGCTEEDEEEEDGEEEVVEEVEEEEEEEDVCLDVLFEESLTDGADGLYVGRSD